MVPYILGYLLWIYTVRAWHISLIINGWYDWIWWPSYRKHKSRQCYQTWIWMHLWCCPLGAHLIHDVLWNRDQVFFFTSKFKSYFYIKKKIRESILHRLIVEWFKLGSCWQQEVLTTSLLLHVIYFCHFYSLLFHYEYENCQLA